MIWCNSNLYVMLTCYCFFISFMTSFVCGNSLMNWLCYNDFIQFMLHDNFRNSNKLIFTHWKHLEPRVNAFWNWFSAVKRYTFHYFVKSASIPGNQSSFEVLQLFDTERYQSSVILFFSFIVKLLWDESHGVSLAWWNNLALDEMWLKVD